jgi:hypothetical protein
LPDETGKRLAAFGKATGGQKLSFARANISFPKESEYRADLQALREAGKGNTGEAAQRTNLAIADAEARLAAREKERSGKQGVGLGWGLEPGIGQLRKNAGTLPGAPGGREWCNTSL